MYKKIILGFLLITAIIFSCSKKESTKPNNETQPKVPPKGVLSMDFSLFKNPPHFKVEENLRCAHFDTALAIVIVWSATTEAIFALPQLAFALAISQTPVYEGELTWRWTLGNVESNNVSLFAHIVIDSVDWTMKVTNDSLSNFVWYTGKCDRDALGGWWRFNYADSLRNAQPALWVGWQRTSSDTNAILTIANIISGHQDYGDTLRYHIDGSMAELVINNIAGTRAGIWEIDWNRIEYWGSIRYPESTEGCWDNSLNCIDCDSLPLKK